MEIVQNIFYFLNAPVLTVGSFFPGILGFTLYLVEKKTTTVKVIMYICYILFISNFGWTTYRWLSYAHLAGRFWNNYCFALECIWFITVIGLSFGIDFLKRLMMLGFIASLYRKK